MQAGESRFPDSPYYIDCHIVLFPCCFLFVMFVLCIYILFALNSTERLSERVISCVNARATSPLRT